MAYFYRIHEVDYSLGGLATKRTDYPFDQTSSIKEILRYLDTHHIALAVVEVIDQTRKHGKVTASKSLGYMGVIGQDYIRGRNGGNQVKSFPEVWRMPVFIVSASSNDKGQVVYLTCEVNANKGVEGDSRIITNLNYKEFDVDSVILYAEPWQVQGAAMALGDTITND